jgi:hypothetical protein
MRRISASLSIAVLLAVQAVPLAQAQMQPQTQGDVTYVSGGIADDWQQAMEAQKSQYNLHLLFAQEGPAPISPMFRSRSLTAAARRCSTPSPSSPSSMLA